MRTQRKEEEAAGGGPFFRARKFRVACIIRAECFMQFHPTAVYASSGEDFNFSPSRYANGFYIPRPIETEGETRVSAGFMARGGIGIGWCSFRSKRTDNKIHLEFI